MCSHCECEHTFTSDPSPQNVTVCVCEEDATMFPCLITYVYILQVTIYHLLKLFQADPLVVAGKKNVVSEHYDEVVFTDPTNVMFALLTNLKTLVPAVKHEAGINCE